jgi:hypothetical protein
MPIKTGPVQKHLRTTVFFERAERKAKFSSQVKRDREKETFDYWNRCSSLYGAVNYAVSGQYSYKVELFFFRAQEENLIAMQKGQSQREMKSRASPKARCFGP